MITQPDLSKPGVLPSQMIEGAIKEGWIAAPDAPEIPDGNIQPASLDLRLGTTAYRLRCSFLPDNEPVEAALRRYKAGEKIPLARSTGMVLEPKRPYLFPLMEELALPDELRAKANPKSSTGRLDIFTRVITDNCFTFDEVREGYRGKLYLEVVSRTFPVLVRPGVTLNQLRLMVGKTSLRDDQIRQLHGRFPLLFRDGKPRRAEEIAVSNGLLVGLDLGRPSGYEVVGYSAKADTRVLDLSNTNSYDARSFWDTVLSEGSDYAARIILQPERFYLLLSLDGIRIPPDYAAEMTAYEPTSGELRTHYAGFFDPGFGFDPANAAYPGSRAALEVRAHDVPFAVEHGQNICKLSFDKLIDIPDRLYGSDLPSNYQGQEIALSKHFKRQDRQEQRDRREERNAPDQPGLFSLDETVGG